MTRNVMKVLDKLAYKRRPRFVTIEQNSRLNCKNDQKIIIGNENNSKYTVLINEKCTIANIVARHQNFIVRIPIDMELVRTLRVSEPEVIEAYFSIVMKDFLVGF